MDFECQDSIKRSSARTRRKSFSLTSEKENIAVFTESNRPPSATLFRTAENKNRKTNLTTGLNISEQSKMNLILMKTTGEQLSFQCYTANTGSARLSTNRGQINRLSQTKKHFQGIIHLKVGELTKEIEMMQWLCKDAQQEYINSLVYEVKAKELASEITNFQKQLAELNFAIDCINDRGDIDNLQLEAKKLEEINNFEKERIESLFVDRKLKEDFLFDIETNQLNNRNPDESPTLHTTLNENKKVDSLHNRLLQSSRTVKFWENQFERFDKIKKTLIQDFQKQFPFINEIIKFEIKLLHTKRKWNEMIENSNVELDSERQKLLKEVKQNRTELSNIEFSIDEINKKINILEELGGCLEAPKTAETKTKKEMEIYLASFEILKEKEMDKLNDLEKEITCFLNELQRNLFLNPTETDLQATQVDIKDCLAIHSTTCEHSKVLNCLKKMELMEFRVSKESNDLEQRCNKLNEDLLEYKSLTKLNANMKNKENKLISKKLLFKEQEPTNLAALEKVNKELEKLELVLSESEKHTELLYLEEKLHYLEQDITLNKLSIEEIEKTATHLMEIINETLCLIGVFNMRLINKTEGV